MEETVKWTLWSEWLLLSNRVTPLLIQSFVSLWFLLLRNCVAIAPHGGISLTITLPANDRPVPWCSAWHPHLRDGVLYIRDAVVDMNLELSGRQDPKSKPVYPVCLMQDRGTIHVQGVMGI